MAQTARIAGWEEPTTGRSLADWAWGVADHTTKEAFVRDNAPEGFAATATATAIGVLRTYTESSELLAFYAGEELTTPELYLAFGTAAGIGELDQRAADALEALEAAVLETGVPQQAVDAVKQAAAEGREHAAQHLPVKQVKALQELAKGATEEARAAMAATRQRGPGSVIQTQVNVRG